MLAVSECALLTLQKKCLILHRVFHGIRIKVNEDWLSGDNQFFFIPITPIRLIN